MKLEELRTAIDLQERTYGLLNWIRNRIKAGTLEFSERHTGLEDHQSARRWIERNLVSFPPEFRPASDEMEPFSRFFASFLTTSFEPASRSMLDTWPICECQFCALLVRAVDLKPRKLTRGARSAARGLKLERLAFLAREHSLAASAEGLEAFLEERPEADADLTEITYADHLVRRTREPGRGEGVYRLWLDLVARHREDVKPKKPALPGSRAEKRASRRFRIDPQSVLRAEERLVRCLTEFVAHVVRRR